jgi:maltose alpha-D-glucosyltransferase/alpha-amylase
MYRVYAQDRTARINLGIRRRLAPLLENDRRRIELMNALLFSLPGTPVIYYGDEIGMGDNFYLGDRNGVRTPMQWSADRNAGFSRANPQKLYLPVNIDPEYHYEAINVETQQNNPHSLLWWMKRILALRRQTRALGRGSLEFLKPENRRVLAFVRSYEGEHVLVVANLSRFAQCAELDLSKFQGSAPQEFFGKTEFPQIADRPYAVSLGPHAFYWFSLEEREAQRETLRIRTGEPPTLAIRDWEYVFIGPVRAGLNRILPYFLRDRRWFRGRQRVVRVAEIQDITAFPKSKSFLLLVRVEYSEGDPELYTLPLSVGQGEVDFPWVLARLRAPDGTTGVLYSGLQNREFCDELLGGILRRRRYASEFGELLAGHTRAFRGIWRGDRPSLEPILSKPEQNNSTVFYGDRFALKLYRRMEPGPHPELELGLFLAKAGFPNIAPVAGSIEYLPRESGERCVAGILHGFVAHGTEAWYYTQDQLGLYFETALARGPAGPPEAGSDELATELIGSYLETIRLLGRRTGEMHAALASDPEDPVFAPEPFTDFYRHGLYHGILGRLGRTADLLRGRLTRLPDKVQHDAQAVLERQPALSEKLRYLRDHRISAKRIRIHGDYHLGQALYTGKDFVMIDLEGDTGRPLSERRIKRSPLEDVAGMLDSFYHASHGVLFGDAPGVIPRPETSGALEAWAKFWYRRVSAEFMKAYLATPGVAALLPADPEQQRKLLEIFLLDYAQRKLAYELTHAAERIRIPSHAILELVEAA